MAMKVITVDTAAAFHETAVQWITGSLLTELEDPDRQVMLGVSGGSTPCPVYERLSQENVIPWERVLCFLVDERYVPATDPESNQRLLWEKLLIGNAAAARALMPNTALPLVDCVRSYTEQLRDLRADVLVLGMGEDGHIASLFPPLPDEAFGPERVLHTTTDTLAVHDRITATLPLLLAASHRLFLIRGAKKAALLKEMQSTPEDLKKYPAQYLFDERTTWLVGP